MIKKEIVYFGRNVIIACDAKCQKAWGINNRPTVQIDDDNEDDYAYLSDNELGIAPINPGTYEGGHAKPTTKDERLNKWCCRECERCQRNLPGEQILLRDFGKRVYNLEQEGDLQ